MLVLAPLSVVVVKLCLGVDAAGNDRLHLWPSLLRSSDGARRRGRLQTLVVEVRIYELSLSGQGFPCRLGVEATGKGHLHGLPCLRSAPDEGRRHSCLFAQASVAEVGVRSVHQRWGVRAAMRHRACMGGHACGALLTRDRGTVACLHKLRWSRWAQGASVSVGK